MLLIEGEILGDEGAKDCNDIRAIYKVKSKKEKGKNEKGKINYLGSFLKLYSPDSYIVTPVSLY